VAEPAVLINVFEVPAAEAERFIVAWERARDYLPDPEYFSDPEDFATFQWEKSFTTGKSFRIIR
jgi:hypothetical protein